VEILAFLGGLLGLIAAIINRKRIVYHVVGAPTQRANSSAPGRHGVPISKRLKRVAIIAGGVFILMILGGAALDSGNESVANVIVWVVFAAMLYAAYQATAIVITMLARLWR